MEVVGVDNPVMDFLIHTERLPETNKGTRLIEYSWQGGGKVSSALVALGRLGVETGIIGVVGDDVYGRFCIEDFQRHQVDTSRMVIDPDGDTTFCICISESQTQGRSIIGRPVKLRKLTVQDLDKEYITSAKYLHLSRMNPVTCKAAEWARGSGMKVAFDADGYDKETEKNYGLIDVFIGSEFYYRAVFNDGSFEANLRSIQRKGPGIVVFTFGEKGCLGVYDDKYFEIPAFKVKVMDTTGAGDVYHGAFLYGLLQGWDVEETARFASAVSAIKCTRVGGRAGIPDLDTVTRFLKDGHIDYSNIDQRVDFYRKALFDVK